MQNFEEICLALQERINLLEEELGGLRRELDIVRNENKGLKIENAGLKERLGLNSKNSSIPSSKELYKINRERPKSELSIGAQPGHKGVFREKMKADEIVIVPLPEVCECGGNISLSNKPYIHQKVDIPEIKPYVVEYQMQRGRCGKCGRRKSSLLPEGVGIDTFGPGVKTIISALTGFYRNSKQETVNILKDIFNLEISIGSIVNSEKRVTVKCKDEYEKIEQALTYSKLLHIDETSHYNKGKLGWCWMFANKEASFIKIADSRAKRVLENSMFGSGDNIIVTDRYAAYSYFNEENRQICWAHLSRDFERFSHSFHGEVKTIGCYLKNIAAELFNLHKALNNKETELITFLQEAKKLRKQAYDYLKEISCTSAALHAARVAKNILKSENMMWKFLEDPLNIPLTNNLAERQIRHYVVYRKNSYFTWSELGNHFLERIISLYL